MRPRITLPLRQLRQQIANRVDRHGEADADVPSLRALVTIAVFIPMTSPRMLSSGPPELPGLIAGVGLHHVVGAAVGDGNARFSALITPIVTVCA
jgi:hypothetical protein